MKVEADGAGDGATIFIAAMVFGPTTPASGAVAEGMMPCRSWNAMTEALVRFPKYPVASVGSSNPCAMRNFWRVRTLEPFDPRDTETKGTAFTPVGVETVEAGGTHTQPVGHSARGLGANELMYAVAPADGARIDARDAAEADPPPPPPEYTTAD